jgi:hypothetical protein
MSKQDGEWPPKGLAKPARRALAAAGVRDLQTLAAQREAEVAALHGMGPNALRILREAMARQGLSFRA